MQAVHSIVISMFKQASIVALFEDRYLDLCKTIHYAKLEPAGLVKSEDDVRDKHLHCEHPAVEHCEYQQGERSLTTSTEPSSSFSRRVDI